MPTRVIQVDSLARVEGEGALFIQLSGKTVLDVKLKIFEPPRFFEAFLRGRHFTEAPDITARICGICPVAYQMSAVHAMEDACGIQICPALRALRRILYCGEWIESHSLHICLLHAPDFLGYDSAISMAKDHPDIVQRGLQLKKVGNEILAAIGGREVHPVNVRVGGFYRIPTRADLRPLADSLKRARDSALENVRWVAGFEFPSMESAPEFVALRHPEQYPLNEGRVVSLSGLDIPAAEFEAHFTEEHLAHSTALHCRMNGRGIYSVGPQARYNLNFAQLAPIAKEAALAAGLAPTCTNPFQSIVIRSVEVLHACDEALRLLSEYEPPPPTPPVKPRAAVGHACTEAPRGLLYHRYRIDADGIIQEARIVPPTSQNQKAIERDLWNFVAEHTDLSDAELGLRCEQAIRNYDPCISCSAHFLKLNVQRV
jgi:coenzyme F420-reducing hydrogenase alpha subunit